MQLPWSPATASLSLQYNSTDRSAPGAGAYRSTPSVLATARWQTTTWKLTDVAWSGRENFGADLRLAGAPGVAVQSVVLSLNPPGDAGPVASITFPSATGSGMTQVGAGGSQGDSFYHTGVVDGRGAVELDANRAAGTGAPSYIYLQLSRSSPVFATHPTVVYAAVTLAAPQAAETWPEATFAKLAAEGIDRAEINLEWAAIEPQRGHFDFTLLDADLADAAEAGVKLIPIFWYSVWPGNPPSWITAYDVGSSGATSQVPVWWDPTNRGAYFDFVQQTTAHIHASPGFGGAFLDYGWLDYMWGPAPGGTGVNGYAPADVDRFHAWLPSAYPSLTAFNTQNHTAYTAWAQVPAAGPGQPLFPVYQRFREWSVQDTYDELSALYRKETTAPLYYYWGGGFDGAGLAFNLPDLFFQVARKYGGTVVLDDANDSALPPLFHSLSQAYGVPLLEEWTPQSSGLAAEMAQFLGHYGFEGPEAAGLDFFIYRGGTEYDQGFPTYVHWLPYLRQIHGTYPQAPVAVYLSYADILTRLPHVEGWLAGNFRGRVGAVTR